MTETYRKWGRVARWEHGVLVHVAESGQSDDSAETFQSAPMTKRDAPLSLIDPDAGALERAASAIADLVKPPIAIERLILTEGVALHEFGSLQWQEHTRRLHLSLARPPYRMLIDSAAFELDCELLAAFAAMSLEPGPAPDRLLLAPPVSAAFLSARPGALSLEQAEGERDGKGQQIVRSAVTAALPPNWYRPSYRVRPVRSWFHLRAIPFGILSDPAPRAVALLSPIGDRIHALCIEDGRASRRSFAPGRVLAAGAPAEWYPYGAGCWGSDILLESRS